MLPLTTRSRFQIWFLNTILLKPVGDFFLTHSLFSIEFIFEIIGYFDVRIRNGPASELLDEFHMNKLNLHRHHLNIYLLYSTLYLYLFLCWL